MISTKPPEYRESHYGSSTSSNYRRHESKDSDEDEQNSEIKAADHHYEVHKILSN